MLAAVLTGDSCDLGCRADPRPHRGAPVASTRRRPQARQKLAWRSREAGQLGQSGRSAPSRELAQGILATESLTGRRPGPTARSGRSEVHSTSTAWSVGMRCEARRGDRRGHAAGISGNRRRPGRGSSNPGRSPAQRARSCARRRRDRIKRSGSATNRTRATTESATAMPIKHGRRTSITLPVVGYGWLRRRKRP